MKYICVKKFNAKMEDNDGTICKTIIEIGTHWELIYNHDYMPGEEFYSFLGDDGRFILVDKHKIKNMNKLNKITEDKIYSLKEARIDYHKNLNIKSCGNCDYCGKFLGSRNNPIIFYCLVKEKLFLFNKAKKCKYYNNRCL